MLDFGLAKALEPGGAGGTAGPGQDPAQSPTVTSLGTMAGVILGTAAYMAPEQARGQEVDHRADIWAFGVVVYEMLTGARLFAGDTVSDTMAAVLTKDPDLDAVPARMRRLLRACLQRDPSERLRDVGDAMLLVDDEDELAAGGVAGADATGGDAPGAAAAKTPAGPLTWLLRAAALIAAAAIGAAGIKWVDPPAPPTTQIFFEQPPAGGRFIGAPIASPDGRHLAMLVETSGGQRGVWVRSLDDTTARLLDGTGEARSLRWSPDSSELLYVASRTLRRVRRRRPAPVVAPVRRQ